MRAEKQTSKIRQEQIARAAMALIAEQGIRGLSVAAVARRVGLVPSALYRHFKGKEEILEATIGLVRDRLMENVQTVRRETPLALDQLRLLMVRHIRMIREFQAIPRIIFSDEMLSAHPPNKTTSYKIIRGYLDQVAEIVAEGQRQGDIHPGLNTQTVSVIFLGLIQPPLVLWTLSKGKFEIVKHMERAWEIFKTAISPKTPKRIPQTRNPSKGGKSQ